MTFAVPGHGFRCVLAVIHAEQIRNLRRGRLTVNPKLLVFPSFEPPDNSKSTIGFSSNRRKRAEWALAGRRVSDRGHHSDDFLQRVTRLSLPTSAEPVTFIPRSERFPACH